MAGFAARPGRARQSDPAQTQVPIRGRSPRLSPADADSSGGSPRAECGRCCVSRTASPWGGACRSARRLAAGTGARRGHLPRACARFALPPQAHDRGNGRTYFWRHGCACEEKMADRRRRGARRAGGGRRHRCSCSTPSSPARRTTRRRSCRSSLGRPATIGSVSTKVLTGIGAAVTGRGHRPSLRRRAPPRR